MSEIHFEPKRTEMSTMTELAVQLAAESTIAQAARAHSQFLQGRSDNAQALQDADAFRFYGQEPMSIGDTSWRSTDKVFEMLIRDPRTGQDRLIPVQPRAVIGTLQEWAYDEDTARHRQLENTVRLSKIERALQRITSRFNQ